ncbi:MAG: glycosyltransferase, partial [Bacteroidia bacterium]
YKLIEKELRKENVDIILFRYPPANKYLYKLVREYKDKIVFEHNTKELEEIKYGGENTKLNEFVYNCERIYGPKVLKCAKGIVGVTNEITRYELQRSKNSTLKSATISNGIAVNKFRLRTPPIYDRTNLNILMLCGSPVVWHGEDLVIKGLAEYKGNIKIHFYIVGSVLESSKDLVKKLSLENKVSFVPSLSGNKLDEIFDKVHIGIGTMGLFRKKLTEAVSLKVREYMARGLPFVLGYNDPDLINEKGKSLFLNYISQECPARIEDFVKFAEKVYQYPDHHIKLRELAMERVNSSLKMIELKKFIESLV